MHKGLKSTLMTVAVALLGFKAMAMAPTIDPVPDVVIGDSENAGSGTNVFVFPNGLDAKTIVHDESPATSITWYFQNASALNHYAINGHLPAGVGVTLGNPNSTDNIAASDLDPSTTGTDTRTFTFRNIRVSPLTSGPQGTAPNGPYIDPGTPGVTTDSQILTLFANDGTTVSQTPRSFRAMILNNGFDKLSGGAIGIPVKNYDWTTGTQGWTSWNDLPGALEQGGVVTLSQSGAGLCADSSAVGANFAGWQSEPGFSGPDFTTISFTDNGVYRVRMTVSTTAAATKTPLWFLYFENTLSWYGGFFSFLDNAGSPPSAASPNTPSASGTVFEEWVNPPAEGTAGFKAVLTDVTNSHWKNFRLRVGVLDVGYGTVGGVNDGYGGSSDVGAICWKNMQVDKFDISSMVTTSTPYNHSNDLTLGGTPASGTVNASNHDVVVPLSTNPNSTITIASGQLSIKPTSQTAWQAAPTGADEFFEIIPGDNTQTLDTSANNVDMADNYPVPWSASQLYRIVYTLKAPDAIAESNPPSFYYMGGYVPTIELISYVYTTNQITLTGAPGPSAMPRLAAGQDYFTFFHGNYGCAAGNPAAFKTMRPFMMGGSVGAGFQGTLVKGGVTITGCKVELVHF